MSSRSLMRRSLEAALVWAVPVVGANTMIDQIKSKHHVSLTALLSRRPLGRCLRIANARFVSLLAMIAAAWAFCASQTAHAIVIWDQSPVAVGGSVTGPWQNISSMQNFTDEVLFASDVIVQGMDIYTAPSFATLGKTVTIRVRIDSPDGTLQEFVDDIDLIDADGTTDTQTQVRAHATFPQPITLLGGTSYWFGMSGFANPGGFSELGQLAIQSGAGPLLDGQMAQYSGTGFTFNTQVGDMAFRLDGNAINGVPEPGTLALLGLAAAGIGMTRRRRSAS